MTTKTAIKSFIISSFIILLVLIAGKVYSQNLNISGNASDSNNSININQNDSSTVNQSNSANVSNNVNANSSTGGNSANDGVGGGNITTGDATTKVNIKNQFNNNVGNIKCKDCPTSTPTPKPSPTPTKQAGGPTSAPTSILLENGKDGDGDGGDGRGAEAGAPEAPAVLGLAAASGEASLFKLIPGFLSILLGFNLLRRRA